MLFSVGSDYMDLGVLVRRRLTNFKKATDELKAHDKKASHFKKLHDFFYVHSKRRQKLEDAIDKCLPQSKKNKIK